MSLHNVMPSLFNQNLTILMEFDSRHVFLNFILIILSFMKIDRNMYWRGLLHTIALYLYPFHQFGLWYSVVVVVVIQNMYLEIGWISWNMSQNITSVYSTITVLCNGVIEGTNSLENLCLIKTSIIKFSTQDAFLE